MADIRSSQNIAQVEYIESVGWIRSSQNIAQVEYAEPTGWTGKINTITNPAKITAKAVVNIEKVIGV